MASGLINFDTNTGTLTVAGQRFGIMQSREGDRYDSVEQASGAITAGAELVLFRDVTNKNKQHLNLPQPARLPQGEEMVVSRVGVQIAQARGNTVATDDDIIKLAYAGVLELKVNQRQISEGPLVLFPSGYGVTGQTNRTDTGVVTVGVASYGSAPNLLVPQVISGTDDIAGTIRFPDNQWLGTPAMPTLDGRQVFTVLLHGIIKAGLGR